MPKHEPPRPMGGVAGSRCCAQGGLGGEERSFGLSRSQLECFVEVLRKSLGRAIADRPSGRHHDSGACLNQAACNAAESDPGASGAVSGLTGTEHHHRGTGVAATQSQCAHEHRLPLIILQPEPRFFFPRVGAPTMSGDVNQGAFICKGVKQAVTRCDWLTAWQRFPEVTDQRQFSGNLGKARQGRFASRQCANQDDATWRRWSLWGGTMYP